MLQTTRNSTDQLFRRLGATSILLPSYYLIENGREKCLSKDVNVGGHVLMFSYIKKRVIFTAERPQMAFLDLEGSFEFP